MVYTGKPSRGCDVCRKRRIKCDEATPGCTYCTKRGLNCPGYKSDFDVSWRDQTITAKRNVQRRLNGGSETSVVTAGRKKGHKRKTEGKLQGIDDDGGVQTAAFVRMEDLTGLGGYSYHNEEGADEPAGGGNKQGQINHTFPISFTSDLTSPSDTCHQLLLSHKQKSLLFNQTQSLLPTPSQSFSSYALAFLASTYALRPIDQTIRRTVFTCISLAWVPDDPTSPLLPAITAVAATYLEAWSFLNPLGEGAFSHGQYVKSVSSLRRRIQLSHGSREVAPAGKRSGGTGTRVAQGGGRGVGGGDVGNRRGVTDDVLMAALMLDMYEGIKSFLSFQKKPSVHVSGTAALVRARKLLPYNSASSQQVLLIARTMIIGRSLKSGKLQAAIDGSEGTKAVLESVYLLTEMTQITVERTPGQRLDDVHVKMLELGISIADARAAGGSAGVDTLKGLLEQAVQIDEKYQLWQSTLPLSWSSLRISAGSLPDSIRSAGVYAAYCDIYRSVYIADALNSFSISRIKLQLTILYLLQELKTCKEGMRLGDRSRYDLEVAVDIDMLESTALETVQSLADDICAGVPFHLGDKVIIRRIDDMSVEYPRAEGWEVPLDHHVTAAAQSGWMLGSKLSKLLEEAVVLREGQKMWIRKQLGRIIRIYGVRVS